MISNVVGFSLPYHYMVDHAVRRPLDNKHYALWLRLAKLCTTSILVAIAQCYAIAVTAVAYHSMSGGGGKLDNQGHRSEERRVL